MRLLLAWCFALACSGCATIDYAPEQLREQVRASEIAFAKTMADRDLGAFSSFLAEETVFFSPKAIHGRQAVTQAWARFYTGAKAPFSWAPDEVEVLASGKLAISSGPVHDPEGKLVGRFMSIWRMEASGQWKVIFDKGCSCPLR